MSHQAQQITCCTDTFFHPDYTVGAGILTLLPITGLMPLRLSALRLAGLPHLGVIYRRSGIGDESPHPAPKVNI